MRANLLFPWKPAVHVKLGVPVKPTSDTALVTSCYTSETDYVKSLLLLWLHLIYRACYTSNTGLVSSLLVPLLHLC